MNAINLLVIVSLFLSVSSCADPTATDSSAPATPEAAIRASMEKQESAWNNGDIYAFMETYWHHDSLLFVGSKGPVFGWQNTLDRYTNTYPDTAAMGKLHFDILQVKQLSPTHCFVLGKWQLTRTVGNASGHFTLLFEKIEGEWVIVADHSS
ncbi:YybH family protein [Parapedobacter koreensis]|uniref:Ketosteroid isomerase homolog n=1 Tax=Parapedobacter koreensis TaxID=332977 RepID=A0A1H7M4V1_9SPHI|nr:nuclear transport factor 2 family protein [Parapedobacter koreensis]SEL05745.1 Ketosteroid isomerase homolog [Parapedobacter koreensis]